MVMHENLNNEGNEPMKLYWQHFVFFVTYERGTTTFSKTTISLKGLFATLSINGIQHNVISVIMLNVILLSVAMLNVVMLSVMAL
jgi:hypothetical protein